MAGDRRPPSWLPWVLCWISLGAPGLRRRPAHRLSRGGGRRCLLRGGPASSGIVLVPLVGALIAARLPANPYGWLWCALGLVYGVLAVCDGSGGPTPSPAGSPAALIGCRVPDARSACSSSSCCSSPPAGCRARRWRWLGAGRRPRRRVGILVLPFAPYAIDAVDGPPRGPVGRAGRSRPGRLSSARRHGDVPARRAGGRLPARPVPPRRTGRAAAAEVVPPRRGPRGRDDRSSTCSAAARQRPVWAVVDAVTLRPAAGRGGRSPCCGTGCTRSTGSSAGRCPTAC